jgi:diaminopimelate decarboxylase
MDHFNYRNGRLHAEDVALERVAREIGTPFYCYSTATLERHYKVFSGAFQEKAIDAMVCYSIKANGNLGVVATLARLGAGADVVSGGELKRAMLAGIPASRIVFSGVGKTQEEMAQAIEAGIHQFNVESEAELLALDEVARSRNVKAPITLRVNPDVDAKTHAKISTGLKENKFGIPWAWARETYAKAATLDGIRVVGIDVHIGSQLTELSPFEAAFQKVADMVQALREDGHTIERLDLGGGLGIPYSSESPPLPTDYAAMIARMANRMVGCQIILEPGRLIVGNAGILVSRVVYVKDSEHRTFAILDAAMNDLIRPALYDAVHRIVPLIEPGPDTTLKVYDVVGPVCETTDTFAQARELPELHAGDYVAFRSAGAYGAVLSSTYNARPLVPEILVKGDRYDVVRRRQSFAEMIELESMPDWLDAADKETDSGGGTRRRAV